MKKENANQKNSSKTDKKLFREWIDLADNDLGFARTAFNEFDRFYSQMCIQAHQATEKYLKGFLIFHEKNFPKIHDLSYLVKQCAKIDKEFKEHSDFCKRITDYYVYLRYPVTLPPRNRTEAEEAIEIAEEIGNLVKTKTNSNKKQKWKKTPIKYLKN